MSIASQPPVPTKYDERTIVNFPNEVTTIRLALSVVLFVLLHFHWYWAGFWLFLLAAGTDWLDGFWARRYGQITILGRMLDPFVDKVIICGTYIFLAADHQSGLQAWMAVLVLGRELLVTALRSFFEQHGSDFSAAISGKLKFILQCTAVGASLFWLSYQPPVAPTIPPTMLAGDIGIEAHEWVQYIVVISVWSMIAITIYSGYAYVRAAIGLIRGM
ncbi:MAG TPA: CDP-diacylglycerol--glycerol-3-phosphate 3-phosphatidyltransferase [Pirellulales bacterium]|jgi:CDP-diacylglycerol--glycerol-3-phosphate 3-phosphatidyltransferase|nr:CDP-diacylglycerol--glycerol-3-phosphate 3-phosphatidyltransferase [Pirellulales bacterium]